MNITLNLKDIKPNLEVKSTWIKDGVDTALISLDTFTETNATKIFSTDPLHPLGAGLYKLRVEHNGKILETNEINLVVPTLSLNRNTGRFTDTDAIEVTIAGAKPGSLYDFFWTKSGIEVPNSRTQLTHPVTGNRVTGKHCSSFGEANYGVGTYKGHIIQGNILLSTSEITITNPASISTSINPLYASSTSNFNVVIAGLTSGQAFTIEWSKGGTVIAGSQANRTMGANNPSTYSFLQSQFNSAPFTGVGDYILRLLIGGNLVASHPVTVTTSTTSKG